jgi:hypothetical protein
MKANKKAKYFSKRGETDVEIKINDEILKLTVIVPTNYQHDVAMDKYTDVTTSGTVDVRAADLLEYRLLNYIISLPFEVPYDDTMETFGDWKDADENQKKVAISMMDPELRDKINDRISGVEELSSEVVGN